MSRAAESLFEAISVFRLRIRSWLSTTLSLLLMIAKACLSLLLCLMFMSSAIESVELLSLVIGKVCLTTDPEDSSLDEDSSLWGLEVWQIPSNWWTSSIMNLKISCASLTMSSFSPDVSMISASDIRFLNSSFMSSPSSVPMKLKNSSPGEGVSSSEVLLSEREDLRWHDACA